MIPWNHCLPSRGMRSSLGTSPGRPRIGSRPELQLCLLDANRDNSDAMLGALAEYLKQQLSPSRRERHIAKVVDDQQPSDLQLPLQSEQTLLVPCLHQLMHQLGRGCEHDVELPLAGCQAEAQGDIALAGAAVAKGDDVLAPQDLLAARQIED